MRRRPRHAGWAAAALLAAFAGCGPHAGAPAVSGSLEEATVKGTVRVRGKPVTGGTVSFHTANINRPNAPTREAPIGKDGAYTVKTLVGQNYVEVSCPELRTPANRLYIENETTLHVAPGANTVDINIPPNSAAAPK